MNYRVSAYAVRFASAWLVYVCFSWLPRMIYLAGEIHFPVLAYGVVLDQTECTVPLVGCKGTLAQHKITD